MSAENSTAPQVIDLPWRQVIGVDLCTSHLPKETAQALDNGTFGLKPSMTGDHGWLFHIPTDADVLDGIECESLKACLTLARDCGFNYVWFDSDGEVVDKLPTFDW